MRDAIHTDRLLLRPYDRATDRPALEAILGHFEVVKWLANFHHPLLKEDIDRLESEGMIDWPTSLSIDLNGSFVGAVAVQPVMGVFMSPDHQGGGLATEAVEAALEFLFLDLNQTEAKAQVFDGNEHSHRILQKLGFSGGKRGISYCAARDCRMRHTTLTLTRADWEAQQ